MLFKRVIRILFLSAAKNCIESRWPIRKKSLICFNVRPEETREREMPRKMLLWSIGRRIAPPLLNRKERRSHPFERNEEATLLLSSIERNVEAILVLEAPINVHPSGDLIKFLVQGQKQERCKQETADPREGIASWSFKRTSTVPSSDTSAQPDQTIFEHSLVAL